MAVSTPPVSIGDPPRERAAEAILNCLCHNYRATIARARVDGTNSCGGYEGQLQRTYMDLSYMRSYSSSLIDVSNWKSAIWRRGELNPCPRSGPRKHLHAYPMVRFKEPNVAPAHCRLPSVREIPSPSDAVTPPND